jgi:membrane protease YdiL (CAAX protease family)
MSEEHRTFPNALEASLLIVVLFALQIAVAFVFVAFDLFATVNGADFAGLIAVAGNGILFTLLMSYKKLRYRELFHPAHHSVTATLCLVTLPLLMLVPGLVIAAGALNSLVMKLLPMTPYDAGQLARMVSKSPVTLLFSLLIAPVLEEMLFRGIILRSFLRQYSRSAAILGSAVLFAVAHLNAYQFVSAMAVGIAAGWLYERTRSLWPGIVLHAAYNGFAIYGYELLDGFYRHQTLAYGGVFTLALAGALTLRYLLMPAKAHAATENPPSQTTES